MRRDHSHLAWILQPWCSTESVKETALALGFLKDARKLRKEVVIKIPRREVGDDLFYSRAYVYTMHYPDRALVLLTRVQRPRFAIFAAIWLKSLNPSPFAPSRSSASIWLAKRFNKEKGILLMFDFVNTGVIRLLPCKLRGNSSGLITGITH